MSRNDDYTTLVQFIKTNTNIPQQINFTGKLEDDGATMFIIAEKHQKFILNFSLSSLIVTKYYK